MQLGGLSVPDVCSAAAWASQGAAGCTEELQRIHKNNLLLHVFSMNFVKPPCASLALRKAIALAGVVKFLSRHLAIRTTGPGWGQVLGTHQEGYT